MVTFSKKLKSKTVTVVFCIYLLLERTLDVALRRETGFLLTLFFFCLAPPEYISLSSFPETFGSSNVCVGAVGNLGVKGSLHVFIFAEQLALNFMMSSTTCWKGGAGFV